MKKMISALLSTAIIILAAAGNVHAQTGDKEIAFIPAKNHAAYVSFVSKNSYAVENTAIDAVGGAAKADASAKAAKANLKAAKANGKAVKAFGESYKDANNATWAISKNAMIATFTKDEVKTDVVYNKNGRWFHTLTYYPGSKTPESVAAIMDDAFPKDDIRLTVQVEEGGIKFYIVQLEGKTTLKKVTIYNGATNVIETLDKGN